MNTERSTIRVAAATTATLLVLACAACTVDATALDRSGGQKTPVPVTLAMAAEEGDWEIQPYIDEVDRLSAGSLHIDELTWDETVSQYGDNAETLIASVRAGDVPMALVPARELGTLGVSSLDALVAPFVVDSLAMQAKLLQDEELTAPMREDIERLGVEAVGILPGPLVRPFATKGPLLSASDFDGATISASEGEIVERTVALLGARYILVEHNGHRFDNVEGSLLPLHNIEDWNFYAPGRSMTGDVALWPRTLVVVANRDAVAALSEEQRAVLQDAVASSIPGIVSSDEQDEVEAAALVCGGGLTFPLAGAADIDGLREAVRPLIDEIRATDAGGRVIKRVEELRSSTPAQRPLECVPIPAHWPTEASDRLDGTYVGDTTIADLVALGIPAKDVAPEDWGNWVLVVEDGRFGLTQENESACTWRHGDWRMNDELVRMTVKNAGGRTPGGLVIVKPGDDSVFNWTDFGGTLALTAAMEDGPLDMALTRVSDVPDPEAFADGCDYMNKDFLR